MRAEKIVLQVVVPAATSKIDPVVLQKIVAWMGGQMTQTAHSRQSQAVSVSTYKEWYNAKYGKLNVKMFDKMATIQSTHGKICAVDVMDGTANDSPSLRRLLPFLPQGTGGDVLADSAYANKLNCAAVVKTGRTPIITYVNV